MSHNPEHGSHDEESEYELLPRTASSLPTQEKLPESNRFQTWTSRILDTWFYEVLAMVFSLLCFAAIICILRVFDDKTRPDFAYGLTLNAIISTLATASKSSLIYVIGECIGQLKWIWFYKKTKQLNDIQLFDSASRGPLGSFFIILQDKGRSLVSLGAMLTILALTFDPFVQQILTYPTRETVEATNSSLAVAKQALVYPMDGTHTFVQDVQSTRSIRSLILSGLWAPSPESLQPELTCPSGNCEWKPFHSVGLCSQCEDITSKTLLKCDQVALNWTSGVYDRVSLNCTLVPPQGPPSLMDVRFDFFQSEIVSRTEGTTPPFSIEFTEQRVWALHTFPEHPPRQGNNATYLGINNPLVVVAEAEVVRTNETKIELSQTLELSEILRLNKATQFALALCSRTYEISVSNGTASFDVSSPDYGVFFSDLIHIPDDLTCWKPSRGIPPESTNVTWSVDYMGWVNVSESAFCGYWEEYKPVVSYVEGSLERRWILYNSSSDWILGRVNRPAEGLRKVMTVGLEAVMSNIAASFTRDGLNISNHTVYGTVLASEVYVSVDWPWLLLPGGLVTLGIVFLGLTILANERQRLRPWRSSILAVLFHGLHGQRPEAEDTKTDTAGQMDQVAQNINVRLRRVDGRGGLVLDRS